MAESTAHIRLDSSDRCSAWNQGPLPPPTATLRCHPRTLRTVLSISGRVERTWQNPLDALRWMSEFCSPRCAGARWVGYLSYDVGRLFEPIPSRIPPTDADWPLFTFTLHEDWEGQHEQSETPFSARTSTERWLRSSFTREAYEAAVARVIDYIAAGDIFQVNLSQRFTGPLLRSPADIYDRLTARTPSLYGAYLGYGDDVILCNSPELFLRVTPDRRVITRPIKGTRPRGAGMEQELRESVKDQAELNMIIDLERNDLGRVCQVGSVRVIEPRTIESHPTVVHGVATIEGRLRDDVGFIDLLRATFPGGSITGAPKIRAMQIIEEIEPLRRGPYCGAIGYLCPDGSMEFNIAIRIMLIRDGQAHIPVGGGIVADSVPSEEYEETLTKAQALSDAMEIEPGRR